LSPETAKTRSDAQRNRARILTVAREVLAADPNASLNAIAKAAGVGAGTLYRHFPTREDLLLTLYREEIAALCASVDDLLDRLGPVEALRAWFLELAGLLKIKHGLGDALDSAAARAVVDETTTSVMAAIRRLLDAGAEAGVLRDGLDPSDVVLLMSCVWRAGDDAQAHRLLDTVIGALRP
jgi:AcrR family transcriptional regulator